jgi:ubiquitin C-terminal hydrolase
MTSEEITEVKENILSELGNKYQLHFDKELKYGSKGMINPDNMCYLNSSLQCLLNSKLFANSILTNDWTDRLNPLLTRTRGTLLIEMH